MYVPLIVLAFLSVAGGLLNIPAALGGGTALHHWLEPVVGRGEELALKHTGGDHHTIEMILMVVSVAVALIGIFLATRVYKSKTTLAKNEAALGAPYKLAYNKFYVDELYDNAIVQPTYGMSKNFLWKIVDVKVIDGIVNGLGNTMGYGGQWLRKIQTGIVQNYAIMISVGVLVLVSYLLM
jgi:NADH-quinone oxidoreductase subunit L